MPKLLYARAPQDAEEERKIRKLVDSRHAPGDWITRARIISLSWRGLRTTRIAEELGCYPQTIRRRLHRFNTEGIDGLGDRPLERNARLSFRNNKMYSYLLRCLLSCESCGLAIYGTTYKATHTRPERRYYQCHGKDPILSAREHKCTQRPTPRRTNWRRQSGSTSRSR